MLLTQEQQTVVDYAKAVQQGDKDEILLINAVAGAAVTKRTAVFSQR